MLVHIKNKQIFKKLLKWVEIKHGAGKSVSYIDILGLVVQSYDVYLELIKLAAVKITTLDS